MQFMLWRNTSAFQLENSLSMGAWLLAIMQKQLVVQATKKVSIS